MPSYLVIVPRRFAAEIGSFLVEFLYTEVETREELIERLQQVGAYCANLYAATYSTPKQLGLDGYLRASMDFVGARSLV